MLLAFDFSLSAMKATVERGGESGERTSLCLRETRLSRQAHINNIQNHI